MVMSKASPDATDIGSVLIAVAGDARAGVAITAININAAITGNLFLDGIFLLTFHICHRKYSRATRITYSPFLAFASIPYSIFLLVLATRNTIAAMSTRATTTIVIMPPVPKPLPKPLEG